MAAADRARAQSRLADRGDRVAGARVVQGDGERLADDVCVLGADPTRVERVERDRRVAVDSDFE